MLTWMLYVLVITLLLGGAALAAECAARRRRTPTRWFWAAAIVCSLIVPTLISSVSIQTPPARDTPTAARTVTALRELTSIEVVPLNWVHEHTRNYVSTRAENHVLGRIWLVASAALLAALALNGAYVSRRKKRWQAGLIGGIGVYIAPDVGPAVVGLIRPRIVIPEWLLEAPPLRQTMALAHEQAHLSGHDPQLLTIALCLVVLMPWNPALWWQLHRLRYAIEVDCDARVLESGLDTRLYGEMLIDVSQRSSAYIGAAASMSETRSFLEERIALIVMDPPKWALPTVIFSSMALTLAAVASQVTPPNLGNLAGTGQGPMILSAAVLDRYVGYYVRGANTVVAITRDGPHLRWQLPHNEPIELVVDRQMNFIGAGHPIMFIQDAQGQTTALVMVCGSCSLTMPRIEESEAQTIMANNETRYRSQSPTPGSEATLRRLIGGVLTTHPDYDEMTSWMVEHYKNNLSFYRGYARGGAVQSIEFRGVNKYGDDTYEVRQSGGTSTWTIELDATGRVADARCKRW
jgi:bla regulator protein blaR1